VWLCADWVRRPVWSIIEHDADDMVIAEWRWFAETDQR
jgi:hypothetical protein